MKQNNISAWAGSSIAGLVAFTVYAFTAYRTICWWDGAHYPLAAYTLGVDAPPGSLLLTLLGWAISKLPIVKPLAFRLNLFAGLLAAVTAGIVTWLVSQISRADKADKSLIPGLISVATGMTFAFSTTIWKYAVQFTPYILTALFTTMIIAVALAWWRKADERDSWKQLFFIFLLFGLDFSVHRTNSLLFPAALVWMFLRQPKIFLNMKMWSCIIGGLVIGLAFHLLLIPISVRGPFLNLFPPDTLSHFWHYVSLKAKGGGFLLKIYPRTSDFVKVQFSDYLSFFSNNYFFTSRWLLTLLPAGFGLLGIISSVRTNWRKGLGLLVFYLCASLGAVIYFNLPANYIRPIDRHYMPSLVIFSLFIGYGFITLWQWALKINGALGKTIRVLLSLLFCLIPISLFVVNYYTHNRSNNNFTEQYARNQLTCLPQNAILLTNGDNDTFPLWYMQLAEGLRTDVTIVNLPISNTNWYIKQLVKRGPGIPLSLLGSEIDSLSPRKWKNTIIAVPIEKPSETGLDPAFNIPDTVKIKIESTFDGQVMMPVDFVMIDVIKTNRWKRPVYMAITVDEGTLTWLWPYTKFEGMAYRVVPTKDSIPFDCPAVSHSMIQMANYDKAADWDVYLDEDSQRMLNNYLIILLMLADAQVNKKDVSGCDGTLEFIDKNLPLARLQPNDEYWELYKRLKSQCQPQ